MLQWIDANWMRTFASALFYICLIKSPKELQSLWGGKWPSCWFYCQNRRDIFRPPAEWSDVEIKVLYPKGFFFGFIFEGSASLLHCGNGSVFCHCNEVLLNWVLHLMVFSSDSVRNVLGELHECQLICFLLVHIPMKKIGPYFLCFDIW